MNQIEHGLKTNLVQAVKLAFDVELTLEDVVIEVPKLKEHGDYSTNVAMRLTKQLRSNPRLTAQSIMDKVDASSIEKMEIAGAGFINFFMKKELLTQVISTVLDQDDAYGLSSEKNGIKINVEYVSANPTGDLHPGHARGAAIGDSLTRIMKAAGYDVTREYYLNDAGNQINNMAKSLQARYLQHCGVDIAVPEDGYHGKDLIEIADDLYQEVKEVYKNLPLEETLPIFRKYGLEKETDKLRDDLKLFRVEFDVWTSEQSLYDRGLVQKTLDTLIKNGHTFESEGALWLRTTDYGDDKDRVLIKSDGSYTYILPDIAYQLK